MHRRPLYLGCIPSFSKTLKKVLRRLHEGSEQNPNAMGCVQSEAVTPRPKLQSSTAANIGEVSTRELRAPGVLQPCPDAVSEAVLTPVQLPLAQSAVTTGTDAGAGEEAVEPATEAVSPTSPSEAEAPPESQAARLQALL